MKIATALGGASTLGALPNLAGAQEPVQHADIPAVTLQDLPFNSGAKLTIERRGQIVLFGINRPYIQNRIDPETFEKLAEEPFSARRIFWKGGRQRRKTENRSTRENKRESKSDVHRSRS